MPGGALTELLTTKYGCQIRFLINYYWEGSDDDVVLGRFLSVMKDMEAKTAELDRIDSDEALTEVEKEKVIKDWKPEGIDTQNMQGYLLIGKRAMTVIGQAQSVSALQALNSRIIFKSNIESDVSIAMPASDLLKKAESIGKETST